MTRLSLDEQWLVRRIAETTILPISDSEKIRIIKNLLEPFTPMDLNQDNGDTVFGSPNENGT